MPPVRASTQGNYLRTAEREAKIQDALAKISDGTFKSIRSAVKETGVRDEITECINFLLIISYRFIMELLEIMQVVFLKAVQHL